MLSGMFTGLIQHVGTVRAIADSEAGKRLEVEAAGWGYVPARGDSIAVAGCCLTAIEGPDPRTSEGRFAFDVIPETLSLTTLGGLSVGSRVNLEHAVSASTPMGGHFVQGHIDGVGTVEAVSGGEMDWRVRIRPPGALMQYIAPKGSICVDGVSLTIAGVAEDSFEVALIPTTLELTTLCDLTPGAACNIEADMLAKQVVHALKYLSDHEAGSSS